MEKVHDKLIDMTNHNMCVLRKNYSIQWQQKHLVDDMKKLIEIDIKLKNKNRTAGYSAHM